MVSAQRGGTPTCDLFALPSARPKDIGDLLDFVDAFCRQADISDNDAFDLRLAIEEVCTNVMMHGYTQQRPGPLEVSLCADSDSVVIAVMDRAEPFDPEHAPRPDLEASPEQRQVGGLGWHLVRRVVDQIIYRYDVTYGNTVTLVKRLRVHAETRDGAGQQALGDVQARGATV